MSNEDLIHQLRYQAGAHMGQFRELMEKAAQALEDADRENAELRLKADRAESWLDAAAKMEFERDTLAAQLAAARDAVLIFSRYPNGQELHHAVIAARRILSDADPERYLRAVRKSVWNEGAEAMEKYQDALDRADIRSNGVAPYYPRSPYTEKGAE